MLYIVVSFTAILASDPYAKVNISDGDVVKFPEIVTNIGDAYSKTSGKFVAPYNGTYQFTASLVNWDFGRVDIINIQKELQA